MKFAIAALLLATAAFAQNPAQVKVTRTSPSSGRDMYHSYCASCHGKTGKGDGPASSALKVPPNDLTLLARLNGGRFPEARVFSAIDGEGKLAAHGSREMPVWGDVFLRLNQTNAAIARQRVHNLTRYIAALQVP